MNNSLQNYLNKQKEDCKNICLSKLEIYILPDLSKFSSLQFLNISYNNLDNIDLNGLIYLEYLDCSYNNLQILPFLPNTLKTLHCNNNKLTFLLRLNNSLNYLNCSHNNLNQFPSLQSELLLNYLDCSYNQLTSLPPLNPYIKQLFCNNNKLTYLPQINMLMVINCNNNQILSLPVPRFNYTLRINKINCENNKISSLPLLTNFTKIYYNGNPIYEINNYLITDDKQLNIYHPKYLENYNQVLNYSNEILNNFRRCYFLSKLRKKIISWM
jgi:hypothetical protein